MQPLILLVVSNPTLLSELKRTLHEQGYGTLEASSSRDALFVALHHSPELVILDLDLEDHDGLRFTATLQRAQSAPILALCPEAGDTLTRVLDAGACDCIAKPVSAPEVLVRIRVALGHSSRSVRSEHVFLRGNLRIDLLAHQVVRDNVRHSLTVKECGMLSLLVRRPGKVVTHQTLLHQIWGPASTRQLHYLRVYVQRLREKLERDPAHPEVILTVPRVGYCFDPTNGTWESHDSLSTDMASSVSTHRGTRNVA